MPIIILSIPATSLNNAHLGGLFLWIQKKQHFSKHYSSINEQMRLLESRGLVIEDPSTAAQCLRTVSYYRLSAYFKPFQIKNDRTHSFGSNITFEKIWGLYVFDRELRLCLSDPIERIEVALRTALINTLSTHYHDLWYLSTEPFTEAWTKPRGKKESLYQQTKKDVERLCANRKEEFIKHYYTKYSTPTYPPNWMLQGNRLRAPLKIKRQKSLRSISAKGLEVII